MTLNQHSPRSSMVKGHGANRKPIDGFLYDLHSVKILSNIVSLIAFEVFDVKILLPSLRTVQSLLRSRMMVPIDSTWVTSYSNSIDPNIISVAIF